MYHKTVYRTLPDIGRLKFTIRSRIIDGETFYYANMINTDLDFYQNMAEEDRRIFYGMEITNGSERPINYRNVDRLTDDILTKYGEEWLETEK